MKRDYHFSIITFVMVLCRVIFPIMIGSLFIISGLRSSHYFLGSIFSDWVTRVLFITIFCMTFWSLPVYYSSKPGQKIFHVFFLWKKLNTPSMIRVVYIFNILSFGLWIAFLTLFSILVFIPWLTPYRILISVINGLIIVIILIPQFKEFQELYAGFTP
jgi:hypothetical protein